MKLTREKIQALLPKKYLERTLEQEIASLLDTEEILIVYGARQVGKSTMLLSIVSKLIDRYPVHFYSLDELNNPDLQSPRKLVAALQADLDASEKVYLIIDEAQRMSNIGLFIKQMYDMKLPLKIFLTGSASFSIKSDVREPLTGRKFEFHVYPFSLEEICSYKGLDILSATETSGELALVLQDYLLYGGYPQVFFTDDYSLKARRLEEIVTTYVERDFRELFGIENINAVRKVATYITENIGNLISIEKITSLGVLKRSVVENIINALHQTFLSYEIYPLSTNKFTEISRSPKIYFHDTGLRNAFLKKVDENLIINDLGNLFENCIGTQLASKYGSENVHYWRTANMTEVDFVVRKGANVFHGYETKYTWKSDRKPRSLKSFEKNYQASGTILHRNNFFRYVNMPK